MTLTPSEGKRLIGKGVAALEPVKTALKEGTIVIATGTTNAYVCEEVLGKGIENKGFFTAGVITDKGCGLTVAEKRYKHHVVIKGKAMEMGLPDLVKVVAEMGPNDVFIKGANAIDPYGSAAVMLGGGSGGTMGAVWGYVTANGVKTIIPVGLEKLIPSSLNDVAQRTGNKKIDKSYGLAVGLIIISGEIITEIEAFNVLTGCQAIPMGAGGIDGGEGSRTFLLDGDEDGIKLAEDVLKNVRGEPPLKTAVAK